MVAASKDINWHQHDPRFDLAKNPNELNRHGWVVEIDPFDPQSTPAKRTALGRFKHENAALAETRDGRAVVYMGDDERGEFIYKFVSRDKINHKNPKANKDLLDHGTLYVASLRRRQRSMPTIQRAKAQWVELTHGKNGIDASSGFANQAEVLIHARLAASVVKATRMDRPEWIVRQPHRWPGLLHPDQQRQARRRRPTGRRPQLRGKETSTARSCAGKPMPMTTVRPISAGICLWSPGNPGVHAGKPKGGSSNINPQNMFNSPDGSGLRQGRTPVDPRPTAITATPATLPGWATTRCSAPTRSHRRNPPLHGRAGGV